MATTAPNGIHYSPPLCQLSYREPIWQPHDAGKAGNACATICMRDTIFSAVHIGLIFIPHITIPHIKKK